MVTSEGRKGRSEEGQTPRKMAGRLARKLSASVKSGAVGAPGVYFLRAPEILLLSTDVSL